MKKYILLIIVCVAFMQQAFSTQHVWKGTSSNSWNTAGNWSPSGVPGASDTAVFDNTCTSCNCTINTTVNVKMFNMKSTYTGTVTQGSSVVTAGTSGFTIAGGTFAGGTGTITMNGVFTMSGGTFTSTSGALYLVSGGYTITGGTFNHNSGTVNVEKTCTFSGSPTLNNLSFLGGDTYATTVTISSGTITVNGTLTGGGSSTSTVTAGTIKANGNITMSSYGIAGTTTIVIGGGSSQTFTGGSNITNVVINKSGGTLTLSSTIYVSGNWTYTAGTISAGSSLVYFNSAATISGSHTLNSATFYNTTTSTVTLSSGTTLTLTGNLNLAGSDAPAINTGTINVAGNVYAQSFSDAGGGTGRIVLNGSSNQTIYGNTSGTNQLCNLAINKSGGDVTIDSTITVYSGDLAFLDGTANYKLLATNGGTIYVPTNNITMSSNCKLNRGTATININGLSNAQTLSGSGKGILPNVTINKNHVLHTSSTLTISGTVAVGGDWHYLLGALSVANSKVIFDPANKQHIIGTHTLNKIGFNNTTGSLDSVIIRSGTTLTVNDTAFFSGTSGIKIDSVGTISSKGNIVITNTTTTGGGSSTINVNGASNQTIIGTSASTALPLCNLTINKSTGTLTINGTSVAAGGSVTCTSGTTTVNSSNTFYLYNTAPINAPAITFNHVNIASGTRSLTGNLNMNGNLTISASTTLTAVSTANAITLQGNWANSGKFVSGTGYVNFTGGNSQTMSQPGGSTDSIAKLNINKTTNSLTLTSVVNISDSLKFSKKNIVSDTTHLLVLWKRVKTAGYNDSSFVSGPVKKIGNTAFTFPLGKNSNAQSIAITAPSSITDAFQAEYFDTNPTIPYGTSMDSTFDYVSTCEYFNLFRKNGTSNIQPTLSYDLSSCVAQMIPAPRVVIFNGTKWKDEGEANFTYSNYGGTISAASIVSLYGHIALGNNSQGTSPIDTTFINLNPTAPPDYTNEPFNDNYSYYANQGQVTSGSPNYTLADSIKFVTEFTSPKLFFANNKVSAVYMQEYPLNDSTVIDTVQRIDMRFVGYNAKAQILAANPSGSSFNYLLGYINSGSGVSGVVGNERLYTPNLYQNIDFHVFSNKKGVKYYFVIRPGGNPANINLLFKGAKSTVLAGDSLTINSFNARMTFQKPIAYYATDSLHTYLNTGTINWTSTGTNQYGIALGSYANNMPLIIEITQGTDATSSGGSPFWSTLIAGNSTEVGRTVEYDGVHDYVFMGGETNSSQTTGFPVNSGLGGFQTAINALRDGFVLAFNPSRALYWGTYIGGAKNDYVHKIKYSPIGGGKLYIAGSTFSQNDTTIAIANRFPTFAKTGAFNQLKGGGSADINFGSGYIARLNIYGATASNKGSREWISFFGSINSAVTGLDEDTITRNVYICGTLANNPSSSLSCSPITGTGMPLCKPYSTSYCTGFSGNSDPAGTFGLEGFVAKFDSSCVLGWSTMIGTKKEDYMIALAVDAANHSLIVVGETDTSITKVGTGYRDTTFNTVASSDAWFVKFNTNDYSRKWQTLFGSTREDSPRGVAIDKKGNAFITGITQSLSNTSSTSCNASQTSSSFPLCYTSSQFGEPFPSGGGPNSVNNFIAEFDTSNSLVWSSIIGSNSEYSEPTGKNFWSGSPAVCYDKVTGVIHIVGTTLGTGTNYCLSSSNYDYNQSINSQYSPSATNAYITEFDGTTNALNWGTLWGGEGSHTVNNQPVYGPSTIVLGDAGTDIVSYNGSVFITGSSYSQNTYPVAYPPYSSTAYVANHSIGTNQDAILAEFTAPSGQNAIQSFAAANKQSEYLVYPNPNNGSFTIQGKIPANAKIQVMNSIGQIVYSAKQENTLSETIINLSNLQQGVYILNIIKENSISSQKILIFN